MKRPSMLVLALPLALLAACGGGDDDAVTPPPATQPAADDKPPAAAAASMSGFVGYASEQSGKAEATTLIALDDFTLPAEALDSTAPIPTPNDG